jgi:Flp pilus assembly protein TadD
MRISQYLLAGLVLLGGCSSQGGFQLFHTQVENHDIPVAQDMDAEHGRRLFLLIVDGLRQQNRSRAALAFLADYLKKYPGDENALLLQADCLVDTGAYAQAMPVYSGLRDGSHAAAAYAGLGRIAAAYRDWPNAAAQFAEASRREPANAGYVVNLGFALVRTAHYDEGVARLREATQLDPNNRVARNDLILGLSLAGHKQEAEQLADTIADPGDRGQAMQLLNVTVASNSPVTKPE